jgi:hypothetical protein
MRGQRIGRLFRHLSFVLAELLGTAVALAVHKALGVRTAADMPPSPVVE